MRKLTTVTTIICGTALALALTAPVYARESPLAGQPAIRHKYELRDLRLEVAPTFEASISADFRDTLSGGLKLEYHITDSWSLGGMVFYGTSINTGLLDQINGTLPEPPGNAYPTPSPEQAAAHANSMPIHGGAGVTWTPWAGKMALFSKVFFNFDVYLSGGFGFAQTKNDFEMEDDLVQCDANCTDADPSKHVFNDPRNDGPHNAGFNPGIQYGGGIHMYFNRFAALDISLRNYMFTDNPSGFDYNADLKVSSEDRRFASHLFLGVGISLYLPPDAKISR